MIDKDRRFSRNQDRVLQGHKRRVKQRKWASALSMFVILCTVLPLVLPAFTLESETFCGYQEHTHSETCYTTVRELTCGYEEGQVIELEPIAHVHNEECWQIIPATEETRELICGYEEGQMIELEPIAHVHTDECWQIIPAAEEGGEETKVLICEHEEGELIPQFATHTHTDECWKITPATEETRVLVCGHEEGELISQSTTHTHTEACYTETKTLICTIPEHVHTEACLANPQAGVETFSDWANLFYGVEKTGDWAKDLVTVAKSQLGYHDVTENFIINEDGSKSYYSRYGAWYGIPYGDWCAMFASFCLYYSDIPRESFPWAAGCTNWGETLKSMGLYEEAASGYNAKPGDLIFFRLPQSETGLDHVGIVIENAKDILTVIEGNYTHEVAKTSYNITDPTIMGYGVMPENPALNEQPQTEEETIETSEPIVEESSEPIAADHSDDPDVKRDSLESNTIEYPEAVFEAELDDGTKVLVNAPKGAFPYGTTMKVEKVDQDEVASVIEENVKGEIIQAIALDITFLNAQGQEIEPQKPIKVQIINDSITPESGKATVVHIDDEGKGQVIDQEKDKEDSSAVTFESDTFSIYVVAYSLEDEVITYDGETFKITVTCGSEAQIPENAQLKVEEILPDSEVYQEYLLKTQDILEENQKVTFVRLFDITILVDGKEVQPAAPVEVQIELINNAKAEEAIIEDDVLAIHFNEEEEEPEVLEAAVEEATVTFNTDGFSVYGIVGTTLQTVIEASDGNSYQITVSYSQETGIPEDAELEVQEILDISEEYAEYVSKTENALGMEEGSVDYIRLFDISIVDKEDPEITYQPKEGTSVDVLIELVDMDSEAFSVVHFDSENTASVVEAETEGNTVSFAADGFSVYAIVPGPSGAEAGWSKLTSLENLTSKGYYIGHTTGYYLTNTETQKTSSGNTLFGIKRTGKGAVPTVSGAVLYYFENASDGKYYIYCMDGENKKYVVNNADASLSFGNNENDKTAFTVEVNNKGVFKIHNGDWYWNMQTGTGEGFYAKKSTNDGNNNLYLWEQTDPNTDTYGLDGKTYGLMTWTGGKTAKALMASENESYPGCLEAKFLTVMTKESNAGNKLYVPNNTSDTVTTWTFEWDHNDPDNRLNSYYYLKADNGKYLKITSNGLSLVDEKDETCLILVKPGTGNNEGQICLKSGKTLTYSGEYAKGYNVGGTAGSEWLYLVEPKSEDLLADYEKVYTATKISVSDSDLKTGDKIIIYARQWKNDHYEYYAINSKGELVPCSESGDSIEWYGGNVNDMLWQFTEYTYDDGVTPNGYYELENLYARSKGDPSYLAPKYSDGSILSGGTVGVLLQGRTNKQYYSPIVAWDTPEYMYSALTVDLNQTDPVLESCVRADGLDFYFAIMEDVPVDDVLHTVPTVDHTQYGIVMKMKDLENGKTNVQTQNGAYMNWFLGNSTNDGSTLLATTGLLSPMLTNGYPTTTNGQGSLGDLYSGATTVNHLFMESTYRATGYYEYNSAQNFAHLLKAGDSLVGSMSPNGGNYAVNDFVVYQELGTNDTSSKPSLQHGQFFPYNDIEAGRFASANPENLYSFNKELLPDSDPRKHEQLYLVKGTTDYYFAMEVEASFVQTPSGLDAWGHDIIFEFSGDDDFWLYVDDNLVIDLGGIHSAVSGKVNFRTGVVVNNGTETTLRDLFYNNYIQSGHTEAEALEYINEKFEQNDEGQWVFKDDTTHTMRIFYMERGAGASNLHMKFNLASVKKGTVELNKELEGVDETETTNAWFPYQVYYRMENETSSDPETMLRNAFDPSVASETYPFGASPTDYVFYKDTTKPVTFLPELIVDGVTYYNVFMLKPGETAVLNFPVTRPDPNSDEITVGEYRIVECGIDSSVFTEVTVNDVVNDGVQNTASTNSYLKDYGIGMASTDDRPKVNYVNKVENLKNLTFTKELYRKHDADTDPVKVNPDGSEIGTGDPRPEQDKDEETFDFRLYFKTPYDNDFTPANLHIYHVKDPEGYYCTWNSDAGCFERIAGEKYSDYLKPGYENGTTDYANLTDDIVNANGSVTHLGKFWASFETSPNGSISGIPAYYTIEVRSLIPGTEYRIVERPTETPDGYKFWQYTNDEGTVHTDPYDPWNGIDGTIRTEDDASAVVKNYKGFGLRLEKVWEDASSIQDRDPAYFAVYKVDSNGTPDTLVLGSVQQLAYDSDPEKQLLYWWYLDLPIADTGLTDYAVFEVKLAGDGITVGDDGVVSGYESIEPVTEGGIVKLNGTLVGESQAKEIEYTVTYAEPVDISDNVRGFKATNSPAQLPPVRFVKTDWVGTKLSGADFSLRYGENLSNSLFDPVTKTSDENGLIAQVYLQENVEYTLTEIKSPQGYVGFDEPLTVTLVATTSGWELNVSPEIPAGYPAYYEVTTENNILTLIVKNRPYDFEAVKVDSTNPDQKLAGAKFDLYKQVTVGTTTTWDEDHPVYEGLTTGANGVIPNIDNTLPVGTYQLRETKAPLRYSVIGNIDFTISELGVITLGNHPDGVVLTSSIDNSGKITYSIAIPNTPLPLKLVKKDNNGNNLTGAKFKLTTYNETDDRWVDVTDKNGNIIYDDIDMTSVYEIELSDLPAGRYRLEETHPPDGYLILTKYTYFRINNDRSIVLTKADGSNGNDNSQAKISQKNNVYTITVKNTPGMELPMTGGSGTLRYTLSGLAFIVISALIYGFRLRRKRKEDSS
ncbi:MAG: fibro-slime domain-containing protein [Firmicutes bacterium]|nr:fibro-slime domain-containing protein [Bacillota bacterium]